MPTSSRPCRAGAGPLALLLMLIPRIAAADALPQDRLIPLRRPSASTTLPPARPHLTLARGGARLTAAGSLRPGSRPGAQRGPVLPDTLRVLVLRISFPPDNDPETTGDGTFDLRTLQEFQEQEGHDIDAAPHDRGYAERHMRALDHYWWANSRGAFSIRAGVYPLAPQGSYVLPRPMAYYGFSSPLGDLLTAYETLVADALATAYAGTDPILWGEWDAFVLFHAGADWQGDAGGARDTPADLPTAYLALGTPVMVGGRQVWDATVVPETVTQDGFIGAINGVFTHEFGHQLGLPDLYDTVGGRTAVGVFSLMDSGDVIGGDLDGVYIRGVLPAALCGWSRWYLGWGDPIVAPPDGVLALSAASAIPGVHPPVAGARLVQVPFGPGQSWLVEYRPDDLDGEPGVSLNWEEGVIDGTATLIGGVKTRTYEYDALLPGSGVLIWRLDESVAEADPDGNGFSNLEENTLQADRLRRFLDLEEADGPQQIGWQAGYLGTAADYWGPLPSPAVFGPDSDPPTRSATGARTGLVLELIPASETLTLTLQADRADTREWSVPIPQADPQISVPWAIARGGGGEQVIVLDASGALHRFDEEGVPIGAGPVWSAPAPPVAGPTLLGDLLLVAAGDSLWFVDPQDGSASALDLGAPAVLRPVAGPAGEAAVAVAGGVVHRAGPTGIAGWWDPGGEVVLLAWPRSGPLLALSGSTLHALEPGGGVRDLLTAAAPWSDLAAFRRPTSGADSLGVALLSANGSLTFASYRASGGAADVYAERGVGAPTGSLGLATAAGAMPVVLVPTAGGTQAISLNGVPAADWPTPARGRAAVPPPFPVGTPMSAGGVIVTLTDAAETALWNGSAAFRPDGHLQLPAIPDGRLTIATLAGKGVLLMVHGDRLEVRRLPPLDGAALLWSGPGGGPHARRWAELSMPVGTSAATSALTGFYVYPNPVRGGMVTVRAEGLAGALRVKAFTAGGIALGEVASLSGEFPGPAEAGWDVSGLAPGVYYLIGELHDGGRLVRRVRTRMLVVR